MPVSCFLPFRQGNRERIIDPPNFIRRLNAARKLQLPAINSAIVYRPSIMTLSPKSSALRKLEHKALTGISSVIRKAALQFPAFLDADTAEKFNLQGLVCEDAWKKETEKLFCFAKHYVKYTGPRLIHNSLLMDLLEGRDPRQRGKMEQCLFDDHLLHPLREVTNGGGPFARAQLSAIKLRIRMVDRNAHRERKEIWQRCLEDYEKYSPAERKVIRFAYVVGSVDGLLADCKPYLYRIGTSPLQAKLIETLQSLNDFDVPKSEAECVAYLAMFLEFAHEFKRLTSENPLPKLREDVTPMQPTTSTAPYPTKQGRERLTKPPVDTSSPHVAELQVPAACMRNDLYLEVKSDNSVYCEIAEPPVVVADSASRASDVFADFDWTSDAMIKLLREREGDQQQPDGEISQAASTASSKKSLAEYLDEKKAASEHLWKDWDWNRHSVTDLGCSDTSQDGNDQQPQLGKQLLELVEASTQTAMEISLETQETRPMKGDREVPDIIEPPERARPIPAPRRNLKRTLSKLSANQNTGISSERGENDRRELPRENLASAQQSIIRFGGICKFLLAGPYKGRYINPTLGRSFWKL